MKDLTRDELEAAHCWDPEDLAPRRMTAYRQRTRYHNARWREAHGHPIGTQPIVPKRDRPARLVGSRLPLDYAQKTGANFLTAGARAAAGARDATTEPYQTFDHQRFWADLLWSPSLAVNLFGDLAADPRIADRAVRTWWPDAPGTVREVRFAHSPGRFDPSYLNSLRTFDAAFVLDRGDGTQGIVAVAVLYHERAKPETPKPTNLWRYEEVAERSDVFAPGALEEVRGTSPFCVMWLEHLLMLSMLQHPSGAWSWGRYVVIHPAANSDIVDLCARYEGLLSDASTFASMTLEDLLDAGALPARTIALLGERYLPR
ncbi:MAG TPA: hypothetical protein VGJ71_14370 [Candidatus Limnocylindrales bacterium]